MLENPEPVPHETLVKDLNSVVKEGLQARVQHPRGPTAFNVCQHYLKTAWQNADAEEKKYLPLVQKRIEQGSLSENIRAALARRAQKTDFRESVIDVYSSLIKRLINNQPYP
jgi:hemerythrin-like domain-containing protein